MLKEHYLQSKYPTYMTNNNILIIEDHPLMVKNYEEAINFFLEDTDQDYHFSISKASDCREAYDLVQEFRKETKNIDLLFLDISIPGDESIDMLSGEDVGAYIKKHFPEVKIIVSTSLSDNYRLSSLLGRLMPSSVMIKNEMNIDEIINTFKSVLAGKKSYSPKISMIIDNLTNNQHNHIDEIDRRIIYETSLGSRIVDMVNIVAISRASIENRKKRLKEILNANNDRELILAAKEKGFI